MARFLPQGDIVRQDLASQLALIRNGINMREVSGIAFAGGTPLANEATIIAIESGGITELEVHRDDATSFIINQILDFTNSQHDHEDAAGGGTLDIDLATTGTLPEGRIDPGSNGQLLETIGGVPAWTSIPTIADFTNATHDHEADAGGGILDITLATTGTLGVIRGGTGLVSLTLGDVLYADAANSLAALGIGAEGEALVVTSGIPAWGASASGNPQKDFYEGMNNQFLQFADFTMPDVGFFPEEDGIQAVVAGAGAAILNSATVDKTGHPGVWYAGTGSTAAGRVFALSSNHSSFNLGGSGNVMRIGTWLKVGTNLSTALESFMVRAGLSQISLPNNVDHGITFEYNHAENGGRWQAITANPTETSTDTGITVVADTWYDLQIEINGDATSVEFFIDGVSVATNTTNIPTGTFEQFYNAHIMKLVGTTVRHILIDAYFVYMELSR